MAVVEQKRKNELTILQKNRLDEFKSIMSKVSTPVNLPPNFQNLNIVYKIASGIRFDLIKSGLVPEDIEKLTGVDSSSLEIPRMKESKRSGVLFQADNFLAKPLK